MHREGPLKNIFKEDNWGDVGKASTFMYTRKNKEDEFDPNEKKEAPKTQEKPTFEPVNSQNASNSASNSEIKEQFERLKAEKDAEISQVIAKINDMISKQNKLETSLEEINEKLKDMALQIKLYKKPEAQEVQKAEKKEPSDKPIDRNNVAPSDVSIEKMFNFSNKKF
jgi:hypothetical protein